MESVCCARAMCGRVGERTDDLEYLDDRAGPARFELTAEVLCVRYSTRVYRFAAMISKNSHDAEDLAQTALERAIRALPRFDYGRGNVEGWLWRIVANSARDARRGAKRRRLLEELLARLTDRQAHHEPPETADELMLTAIHRLPDRQRAAIALRCGGTWTCMLSGPRWASLWPAQACSSDALWTGSARSCRNRRSSHDRHRVAPPDDGPATSARPPNASPSGGWLDCREPPQPPPSTSRSGRHSGGPSRGLWRARFHERPTNRCCQHQRVWSWSGVLVHQGRSWPPLSYGRLVSRSARCMHQRGPRLDAWTIGASEVGEPIVAEEVEPAARPRGPC